MVACTTADLSKQAIRQSCPPWCVGFTFAACALTIGAGTQWCEVDICAVEKFDKLVLPGYHHFQKKVINGNKYVSKLVKKGKRIVTGLIGRDFQVEEDVDELCHHPEDDIFLLEKARCEHTTEICGEMTNPLIDFDTVISQKVSQRVT